MADTDENEHLGETEGDKDLRTDVMESTESTKDVESGRAVPLVRESREEMLARHRRETKELQHKDIQMKKDAAKGSKSEQKAKKKAVEEEIAKLNEKMKSRQSKELASLGFSGGAEDTETPNSTNVSNSANISNSPDSTDLSNSTFSTPGGSKISKVKEDVVTLAKAMAGMTGISEKVQKVTKAQKRRDKKMKEEVEREQRIQEENSMVVSEREIEDKLLREKLEPLSLTLKEIKPDGHCLYRAVEDQLSLGFGRRGGVSLGPGGGEGNGHYDYKEIRSIAARYMRENAEKFLPFVISEFGEEGGPGTDEDPEIRFEKYCCMVEGSAAWGGQLELEALSHALKRHITVIAAESPDVHMGMQYGNGDSNGNNGNGYGGLPPIRLSYHKHEYGLGEHYNSVVPQST